MVSKEHRSHGHGPRCGRGQCRHTGLGVQGRLDVCPRLAGRDPKGRVPWTHPDPQSQSGRRDRKRRRGFRVVHRDPEGPWPASGAGDETRDPRLPPPPRRQTRAKRTAKRERAEKRTDLLNTSVSLLDRGPTTRRVGRRGTHRTPELAERHRVGRPGRPQHRRLDSGHWTTTTGATEKTTGSGRTETV